MKLWRRPLRFAYLFERFPSFTQTFCTREVGEMIRRGVQPPVFSIRERDELAPALAPEMAANICYLPEDAELTRQIKQLQSERKIPRAMNHALRDWTSPIDKHRVYAAAWLAPVLKQKRIKHVHAHFAGLAARTAYWLKKFYGIPYSFTGHANDIFVDSDFPVSLTQLVAEAEFVATATGFSRDWLSRKFPAEAGKIHRVYNGIQVEAFRTDANRRTPPLIISVGRCIEKKGFGDLIEACALLKKRGLEFECEIVGEGPLEWELRARIEALGVGDCVRLTGALSESDILRTLAAASVFALPCVTEAGGGMDNLPTVIMEAMASGLPVVSTPIAGVPEMVIEGETGFLVPQKNPEAVAAAIAKLLEHPALATEFGKRARARAVEMFSIENSVAELRRLLQR